MPGPEQLPGICHSFGTFRTEQGDGMLVSEYLPGPMGVWQRWCFGNPFLFTHLLIQLFHPVSLAFMLDKYATHEFLFHYNHFTYSSRRYTSS